MPSLRCTEVLARLASRVLALSSHRTFQITRRLAAPAASVALVAAMMCSHQAAHAQYRVFDWVNFNDGKLPANVFLGHFATPELVKPLALASPGAPPSILDGIAATECGPASLSFTPNEKRPHLSIMSPLALDRNLLGDTGRALYQADLFLPAKEAFSPSISLLAAYDAKGDRKAYHWYRFGMMPNSNVVFFAFANNTEQPSIYHQLKIDTLKLKRPGWHRFQIVFEGRDRILCAIDGTPVKFPEIREGTLRKLNAGVFVANSTAAKDQVKIDVPAVVDNLSIQYTPTMADFPDSPWVQPVGAVASAPRADASLFDPASGLNWMDNTQDAWAVARATKRPLMVLWYVPRSTPTRYLDAVAPKDATLRSALQNHVLLRIDVNQLAGGYQAQKFNIVRVPTLMVLDPEGQEQRRLPVIPNHTQAPAVTEFVRGG